MAFWMAAFWAANIASAAYSFMKPKKKYRSPIYKNQEKDDPLAHEYPVPVCYGHTKVQGHIIYRENVQGTSYDVIVGLCEGPVEAIDNIELDGVPIGKYGSDVTWTEYLGTADQTGDARAEKGMVILDATEDVYIDENDPDTNFNDSTNQDLVKVYEELLDASKSKWGLLKFDLSTLPSGLTIESARLTLRPSLTYLGGVKVYGVDSESWDEDDVTWNTAPGLGAACTAINSQGVKDSYEKLEFIAGGKTYIETAYTAGGTVSFALVGEEGLIAVDTDARFSSKDSAYLTPRLVITFSGGTPQAFRNTAYIAMTVDTASKKISTDLPEVTAVVKARKIKNWDTVGEAYQTTYSANPVWEIYDILTNSRFGIGIAEALVNDATFKTVAAYCDTEITGPDGQTEKRYESNITIDDETEARAAIRDILTTCGMYFYFIEGKICIGIEKSESSSGTFTDDSGSSNIIEGSFWYKEKPKEDRPNVVRVLYTDKSEGFKKVYAQAEDELDILDRGKIVKEINAYGINTHSQASRIANMVLRRDNLCEHSCGFRVSINDCDVAPGDVVSVSHDVPGWTARDFRVITAEEFQDSDEIELVLDEYDSAVYDDEGVPKGYQEVDDPQMYEKIMDPPPQVTGLVLSETYEVTETGGYQPQIKVEFTMPDYIYPLEAVVYLKKPGGDYKLIWQAMGEEFIVDVKSIGTYYVKVRTHSYIGRVMSDDTDAPLDTIVITARANLAAKPTMALIAWDTDSGAVWSAGNIGYMGVYYAIDAGTTTDQFIFFDPDISTTVLQTSATMPVLGANGWIVAVYHAADDSLSFTDFGKAVSGQILIDSSITASKLAFVPGGVDTTNIVATINATSEGLRITAGLLEIDGSTEFSAGYNPSDKLDAEGGSYDSAPSGARVRIFPDANTGIQIIDDAANDVFKAIVGGTDVGDIALGDYANNMGMLYDKSAGKFLIKGAIVQSLGGDEFPVPVNRGDYLDATVYYKGDLTVFQGTSYLCILTPPGAGTNPLNTTYWAVFASKGATGATGSTGDTGATGAAGADGADGDPGPGVVYRGEFSATTDYFNTSIRRDVVQYSGSYYLFKGTSGTQGAWDIGNWDAFGATFSSVATALLLAEDATILRTLVMGDGTADLGIIRSSAKGSFADTDAGYWIGMDGTTAKVNIGNATRYIQWTGTALSISGDITLDNASNQQILLRTGVNLGITWWTALGAQIAEIDEAGNATFVSISGPLTGNVTGDVTGNVSGSSGSCTGNAATASSASQVANALFAGSGLTAAGTFNGAAVRTFACDWEASGGDNGTSTKPARSNHAHSLAYATLSHNHNSDYAPIAKGVTNGDSHDHNGGDGAQIAYSTLSGLPDLSNLNKWGGLDLPSLSGNQNKYLRVSPDGTGVYWSA